MGKGLLLLFKEVGEGGCLERRTNFWINAWSILCTNVDMYSKSLDETRIRLFLCNRMEARTLGIIYPIRLKDSASPPQCISCSS